MVGGHGDFLASWRTPQGLEQSQQHADALGRASRQALAEVAGEACDDGLERGNRPWDKSGQAVLILVDLNP